MWNPEALRAISADEMRALDRRAIEQYDIPGLILMENAGRSIAREAMGLLGDKCPARVHVIAGAGNNGGDGFVIARHLANWGHELGVTLAVAPDKLRGDALTNYRIAAKMGLDIAVAPQAVQTETLAQCLADVDLIVDALLGTGTRGTLRPPFDHIIESINRSERPALSVDIPSGLEADTGRPLPVAVKAALTVTCGAPKKGLLADEAQGYVGRLVVAYISLPRAIEPRNPAS